MSGVHLVERQRAVTSRVGSLQDRHHVPDLAQNVYRG